MSTLRIFLLLPLFALTVAKVQAARQFYLTASPTAAAGTGTASQPLNVSTPDKFDAFWTSEEILAIPTTYHFAAGNYYTKYGIIPRSNQSFIGAGQAKPKIYLQTDSYAFTSGWGGICNFGYEWQGNITRVDNVSIQGMTLDGGADFSAVNITSSFVVPPTTTGSNTQTVAVSSTNGLTPGYCYYIQDTSDANGTRLFYGVYLLTQVNSANSITLQNTGTIPYAAPSPTGKTVPTTALLLPYSNSATTSDLALFRRPGIMLMGSGIQITNVTVQNVASPSYEGPAGIGIGGFGAESNNLVQSCTVEDVYGTYPTYLWITDIRISSTAFTQCNLIGNTVLGNGYYQGIGGWQSGNCTIRGNTIKNVQVGYFCDSGSSQNNIILNNRFSLGSLGGGQAGIYVQGNGGTPNLHNCTFSQNTILVPSGAAAPGIWAADPSSSNQYVGNRIMGYGSTGIQNTSKGTGNAFSRNIIYNTFQHFGTVGVGASGTATGNVDQNGRPVSLGM